MEIRYVGSAIANNFGDYIELNENLKKYPKLHDAILKHELKHTKESGFTKEDFMLDIGESTINNKELLSFVVKHPASLLQIVPVYIRQGKVIYDLNMLIIWGVFAFMISGGLYLAIR